MTTYFHNKKFVPIVMLLVAFLLLIIATFRPIGFDRDSLQYLDGFLRVTNLDEQSLLEREPSFLIISLVLKSLFGNEFRPLLFIYALLSITIIFISIKRLTPYPLAAICCFSFIFFPLHTMTQIRVGVACAIFLWLIPDLVGGKWRTCLLKAIFATFFHYSAVVVFFVFFLNFKSINLRFYYLLPVFGLLVAVFGGDVFTGLVVFSSYFSDVFSYKLNIYISLLDDGVGMNINLFSFYYVFSLCLYYIFLFNIYSVDRRYNIVFAKIFGWSLFAYYSLSFLPAVAVRLSEFFGVVIVFIFPAVVFLLKNKLVAYSFFIGFLSLIFINNVFVHGLFNF